MVEAGRKLYVNHHRQKCLAEGHRDSNLNPHDSQSNALLTDINLLSKSLKEMLVNLQKTPVDYPH